MIRDAFPDPVDHVRQAAGRISREVTAKRSPDVVGRFVDGVVHGGLQTVKEVAVRAPIDFVLAPAARLTGRAVKSSVGFALQYTAGLLRNIPFIPVSSANPNTSFASVNDIRSGRERLPLLPSANPVSFPRGTGSGQGQTNGNPDAQPGAV